MEAVLCTWLVARVDDWRITSTWAAGLGISADHLGKRHGQRIVGLLDEEELRKQLLANVSEHGHAVVVPLDQSNASQRSL